MLSQINLPPETIKKEMELIFNPVKFGESGIVVCYPACQQDFNITRFLTYKKQLKKILGPHHNRFAFLLVHLNAQDTHESFINKFRYEAQKFSQEINGSDSLPLICQKILKAGRDPYLFLFNVHALGLQSLNTTLSAVNDLVLGSNRFGAQVFFEGNIYRKDLADVFSKNKKLLRNVEVIPGYNRAETVWYLNSLSKEWRLKLSKKTLGEISGYCIGNLWILREIMRLIKVTKNVKIAEILNHPSVKIRVETVSNMLASREKMTLFDLINQRTVKDDETKAYLFDVGLVAVEKNKNVLTWKVLERLLAKSKTLDNFYLDEKQNVVFEGKDIGAYFSNSELRIIRILLAKKGQLVSRDEVARAIWKIHWEEKYSDWAIDKIVSRLRTTLTKLNFPKNMVTTLKGRGFILN